MIPATSLATIFSAQWPRQMASWWQRRGENLNENNALPPAGNWLVPLSLSLSLSLERTALSGEIKHSLWRQTWASSFQCTIMARLLSNLAKLALN